MSNLQSFVLLSGTMLTTLIAWYFWFMSEKTGEFGFQYQMGVLCRKLVVQ